MSINLYNSCLSELLKDKKITKINTEPICHYLKTFKSFIYLLKHQTSLNIEKLLTEISRFLEIKKVSKNELIFQQGEIADNFYIILKGNLKVLKLRPYEYYMTNEEYISFLLDLRMYNQKEIIRQSKHYNNLIYPIPDNFDLFVKNLANKVAGGIYIDMNDIIEKAEKVNTFINQEEIMKTNIQNLSPTEYINKFQVPEDIIYNTEIINNYINEKNDLSDPESINKIKLLMKDRKKVLIPNYEEFVQLNTGGTFEDQAFENHGNSYQSSVISLDDGYLGYINKIKYDAFFHESVEKRNKKIFGILVYFSFLNQNNLFLFEKKYLTYINDKAFEVNEEIFKEGEESEYTYFLIKGEYELSMNKNIMEVNDMIIHYKKILKKLNSSNKFNKQICDFEEEKRQNNDLILNKKYRSDEENELLMKKRYIKLNILFKKDVIGLSDIYEYDGYNTESKSDVLIYQIVKKKCLLTCKCINSNCHVFYIPNSIFNNIYYHEGNYNIISKNLEYKKICSIIDRLQIYKNSIFDLIKSNREKLAKRIKILKEVSKSPKFNKSGLYKPKICNNIFKDLKKVSKEQSEKLFERTQKQIFSLKKCFDFRALKSNTNIRNDLFPSIIRESGSNKNIKNMLWKGNKTNQNNFISIQTYNKEHNAKFKKLFIKNLLYENLFYNYTINKNINNRNDTTSSFTNTFDQTNFTTKNERYKTMDNKFKFSSSIYNNEVKKNCMSLKRNRIKLKEKLIKNNKMKTLIGCYDPLAFEKFNHFFSFNFKRHIDDFDMEKSNNDY